MTAAHIPDLAARRGALDPAQSCIVQAPAGSGKTELLIQRYLLLLAYVDHPEEIVAVTFTRKAAGEMRERVLAALADARAAKVPETEHEKLTLELAAAALQCDTQAGWRIAENPARLRIQTIDSLCAGLTRQMPMLSRFGSPPESIEDAAELYLEAARATVELVESVGAVAQDIERLLAHLDNDVARIETLLADMLRRRDHWLRHVHGRERAELEAALQNARLAALERVHDSIPGAVRAELTSLADYAFGNLGRGPFAGSIEDWIALAGMFLTDKGGWRKKLTKAEGFPAGKPAQPWKERALALFEVLAAHDGLRAALDDMRDLPPERYSDEQWEVLGAIMRLLPRAVGQLKLVFQARGQVDFTEVSQAALRALATEEGPTDLALALDYRIRHLLIDEFQDTSISQYELVAGLTAGWEPGDGRTVFAVGDPMQSIYRFREAEVGLFLRARAAGIAGIELRPIGLTANFRSQAGIVAWVNATFKQVMPEHEDIAKGAVPYTASVATHAALGGAAVSVHPFFNGDRVGEAARVVEIVAQARRDDPTGRIAILVRNRGHLREIVPQLKDAGLRFRAIEIEELGHRPVVQDLLALTRALAHPADRLAWLALLRAPWCGLTLADLHALASIYPPSPLMGPADTAFAERSGAGGGAEARSPQTAGFTGNVSARQGRGEGDRTIWELMNDDARIAALSPDGRSRLVRAHAVLKECLEHRCRGALRERVAGAWYALGGPACVEDTTDLEDAEIYFEYLEAHEQAGEIADPVAFEEGLDDLYALPDLQADERLQIMTIHKAKGLEFDAVIVPGLGRAPRSDEKKLFLWMEQPQPAPSPNRPPRVLRRLSPARGGEEQSAPLSLDGRGAGGEGATDLLLAPIQATGADGDLIYAWLQKLDSEKEGLEDERLLYVAATRAKQRLHLLGDTRLAPDHVGVFELKPPNAKALLSGLWPMVEPIYAAAATRLMESPSPLMGEGRGEGVTSIDQSLRRLESGWALPASPAHVKWIPPRDMARAQDEIEFSWVGATAREVGSVVHRWLQRIADDELKAWDAARIAALREAFRRELVARGVADNDLEAATGRVVAALTHAVMHERGRWLLGPQQDAHNELRMTAIVNGERVNLVIDRTFRGADDKLWIVDYKTSSHEGADVEGFLDRERVRYEAQLKRYAAAVGEPQRTMLGLYFPLLAGWREWAGR
jgi:ATP-dependent exoDNAse (exonuclease V) beta subunit